MYTFVVIVIIIVAGVSVINIIYLFADEIIVGKISFSLQDVIGHGSHGTVVYRLVYVLIQYSV